MKKRLKWTNVYGVTRYIEVVVYPDDDDAKVTWISNIDKPFQEYIGFGFNQLLEIYDGKTGQNKLELCSANTESNRGTDISGRSTLQQEMLSLRLPEL